jgi:putative ABC transport system ATP-binding protein
MTTAAAIHIQGARFAYIPGHPILSIDELSIPSGHRIFVHGPSGSGKTTLLSLISGVLVAQQGSVNVLGQDLTRLSASARDTLRGSRIGYIFQGFNLIPYLTVAENIALPCDLHRSRRARISAPTVAEEVVRLARRLDIHTHLNAPVTNLSTGQQQRVAIARALVGQPKVLLADEPTGNLDSTTSDEIMGILRRLNEERGITVVLVTHEPDIAAYAKRVIVFRDGHLESDARRAPRSPA